MRIIHFQLVRFLKTLLIKSVDKTDTEIIVRFIELLYIYSLINHDELDLLRECEKTL